MTPDDKPRIVPTFVTLEPDPPDRDSFELLHIRRGERTTEVVIGIVEGTPWTRSLNRLISQTLSQVGSTPALGIDIAAGRSVRGRHRRPTRWTGGKRP